LQSAGGEKTAGQQGDSLSTVQNDGYCSTSCDSSCSEYPCHESAKKTLVILDGRQLLPDFVPPRMPPGTLNSQSALGQQETQATAIRASGELRQ